MSQEAASLYTIKLLSSLEKVFPDKEPPSAPECTVLSALWGESVSFQAAYYSKQAHITRGRLKVESDLGDRVTVRGVNLVPSMKPTHTEVDDNYLRTAPGLYPDLLRKLHNDLVWFPAQQWHSLWFEVDVDKSVPAGEHTITISIIGETDDTLLCSTTAAITVYAVELPPQKLIRTEWFHTDCLSTYYGIETWSQRHWEIIESFIHTAVKRGINMILTPVHTPPLDTAVGGERPTVQLIDITVENGKYSFNFDKLKRWVEICERNGVEYYEIAHLFSQWGATCAPKIMATVDGEYKKLFGWHTPAVGGDYTPFLQLYVKAIIEKMTEWGLIDRTYFHISDEPYMGTLETYKAALESVKDVLAGQKRMDALSDYEFYKQGLVPLPVPSNNHIDHFIENNVPNLWTYYCTSQWNKVSNRYFSMPSSRNRVIGLQMYLYDIVGFLQWGYNFYYSQQSIYPINPYAVTDSVGAFPSGDPFMVYPGDDGNPEESLRLVVFYNAISDMRALQLLESLKGREFVLALVNEGLSSPITFTEYPKSDFYYIQLRNLINWEINKAVNNS